MTPPNSLPAMETSDEVSALIEILHQTGQRLEELTAGEVDTVTDREGKTFVLRRAQEQLRHTEAARQAAILDALPAHIALLDVQGFIVSVNESWRRYSGANSTQDPGHAIGVNYLEICDYAQGNGSSDAHRIAEGIRAVLDCRMKNFSIEYPCHSPSELCWFLLTVTPLADDRPNGAVVMHLNITEQERAREKLRQNEERTRLIVESALDALVVMDASGRITDWNAQAEKTFGWSRGEAVGVLLSETIIPARYREAHSQGLRRFLDAGEGPIVNKRMEFSAMHRDGHEFPVELTISPVRLEGAWIFSSFVRDLTERKNIEAEVHETRNFLASIFDNIPNSIFVKDAQHLQFVRVNTACEKLTGYSEKEFLGKSDYDLFPREQAEVFVAKDRETLAGHQRVVTVEETITSRDGTQKILQTKKFPILGRDGLPLYLLGMSEDITARKQSERLLGESEAKFRQLIEQADDGIFLSDKLGNFMLVNSRGCELLGYTHDELLGMNAVLTYPQAERASYAGRWQALDALTKLRFERVVQRKDGTTFPAELTLKLVGDDTVQGIFRDITGRRTQEQKISRLSRLHAVLSGINAAIVRIRDRRELFQEACRIIVEHGRFTLGWIAVLDHMTGKLTAVAQAGLPAGDGAGGELFDGSLALLPGGTAEVALREKRAAVDNAIENAPGPAPDDEQDTLKVRRAAIRLGAQSVIVLPLFVEGKTFGILTLYAPERNFFDEEEIELLNDLAGDVSFGLEFIAKEEKVDYLAYYDALTGLANRSLFLERVAQYMRSAAGAGHKLGLFLFDLERFKNINDSLGRLAGDALLKQVAQWLTLNLGDANLFARVDSDHFAIVLPEIRQEGNVLRLIEKTMRAFMEHPFRLNDAVFRITAKVGAAIFPVDGSDADTLFRNAEAALKKAKASGERYLFYTQRMTETVAIRLTLENQLRQALDNEEFVLHYQPKVNLVHNKLTGAEALIRWNDPRTGLVPPGRFIPILEETGLIYEVGRWALRKAIEDYLRWHAMGLAAVRIAVNVSPLQLRNRGFVSEIRQVVGIEEHAAAGLELEITESLIMEDVRHNITSLQAIRDMGIGIAIDDFGTGFSSLNYLAKLPVDTLKIDRSFVIDMTAAQQGLALVSTIINLAHSLKLNVVAEGVETEEQSRLLRLIDCDEMQGYLFSKPVPGDIFEARFLAPRLRQ